MFKITHKMPEVYDLKPRLDDKDEETLPKSKSKQIANSKSFDTVDLGFSRLSVTPISIDNDNGLDTIDLPFSRQPGSVSIAQKADLLDCFVAVISICTFLGDIGTDILAAHQYFNQSRWSWFGSTLFLIIVPSFVLQLFSSKWYHDDHQTQSVFSYVIHFLQLSTIER